MAKKGKKKVKAVESAKPVEVVKPVQLVKPAQKLESGRDKSKNISGRAGISYKRA